jgi:hypothetical protein
MSKKKFESLRTVAKKLGIENKTLLSLIDCHDDLLLALSPYRNADNKRKNKRLIPPTVTKLIYERFADDD